MYCLTLKTMHIFVSIGGSSLPTEVAPTTSARPKPPKSIQKQGKVIKLR